LFVLLEYVLKYRRNSIKTYLNLLTKIILTIKANEMHYFSNLFDKVIYMFRTGPLSIIRIISALYTQQQVFIVLVLLAIC